MEKELRRKNEKVTDIGERLDRTLARYRHLKDDYELMMAIKDDTSYPLPAAAVARVSAKEPRARSRGRTCCKTG